LLTSVSGVGTKVGIGILSSISPGQLVSIIMNGDVTALTKAQGVGKKTASRIVLELKDKIEKTLDDQEVVMSRMGPAEDPNEKNDALEALITLGYSSTEIQGVFRKIDLKDKTTEEIIKVSLRELMLL